ARPRKVVDADLDDVGARAPAADEELGVDEAALAGEPDLLQQGAAEELEGEVDVAEVEPEEGPDQSAVDERVERPPQPFRSAVEAVGGEHVRLLVFQKADGPADLVEIERKVGV